VADHVAHGDFLGTCEFRNSGGLSRASEMRSQRPKANGTPPDFDPMMSTEDVVKRQNHKFGAEPVVAEPEQNLRLRKRTRATR